MSCSMTIDAVRARTKTVTRRHVDTWRDLKPGDRLTLIEKGMGLPKGSRQVVLAEVEIVDVNIEGLLDGMSPSEVEDEGFPGWTPETFVKFWLKGHGYGNLHPAMWSQVACRRIEWRYLDEETGHG